MPLLAQYLSASAKPLYNGFEPDWPKQPWLLPRSDTPVFAARLGHDVQLLAQAVNWLSKADFQQLPRGARAEVRDWSGRGNFAYLGTAGLHLHHVREDNNLWGLAAGKRQPARFQTFLHGLWQVIPSP